jgi:hypothetical protein
MITELFQKAKQFRFGLFLAIYVLFSIVGAYNLAHLAVFSYVILLLEQLVADK